MSSKSKQADKTKLGSLELKGIFVQHRLAIQTALSMVCFHVSGTAREEGYDND